MRVEIFDWNKKHSCTDRAPFTLDPDPHCPDSACIFNTLPVVGFGLSKYCLQDWYFLLDQVLTFLNPLTVTQNDCVSSYAFLEFLL
jgi:hypothetical protein